MFLWEDYYLDEQLNEALGIKKLNEDINDGWEIDDTDSDLLDVFDDLQRVAYELKNCIRGSYTKCTTYKELAMYLKKKAEESKTEYKNKICAEIQEIKSKTLDIKAMLTQLIERTSEIKFELEKDR